ncbi:lipopolysaccharide biosynthesis protein [Streptomyces sp.]|uniref:lipopolysaccharide biosynthesis protein n=1 Tax=Streptomyces sp. TaxID=1931 RepID=UPI002F3E85EE
MDEIRARDRKRRRALPHWLPLPLGLGLGLLGGLGYGLAAPHQYTATSYVVVVPQHAGDSATALGFAQAYARVVTGSGVLAGAQSASHIAAADLKAGVRAATSPDAPMISVTGSATRPSWSATIANAVADSLAATGNRDAGRTGVRLLLLSRATPPTTPSSPSPLLSAAVGTSAGGLLGALALLVRPEERYELAATVPAPAHEPAGAGM